MAKKKFAIIGTVAFVFASGAGFVWKFLRRGTRAPVDTTVETAIQPAPKVESGQGSTTTETENQETSAESQKRRHKRAKIT